MGLREGAPPTVFAEQQIRFQPPDPELGTHLATLGTRCALCCCLVDSRENLKLRSNHQIRRREDDTWTEEAVPNRMDCHYLISAWRPEEDRSDAASTEHALLYEVTDVLMQHSPLNPLVFLAGS